MEIHGRDIETESYRVTSVFDGKPVKVLVPERLVAETRPSHETAFDWIARNQTKLEGAIAALATGKIPKRPFDQITLVEDA